MADIAPPRHAGGSKTATAEPSPPSSQPTSIVGSPELKPTAAKAASAKSSSEHLNTNNTTNNGTILTPPLSGLPPPPPPKAQEKPSMTKRLTRMFSTKDATRTSSENGASSSTPPDAKAVKSTTPSRQTSVTDKGTTGNKAGEKPVVTPKTKTSGKDAPVLHRYQALEGVPGGHEHHLKSNRRQEKLSDMLRDLIGSKKKMEENNDTGISLVSTWVETINREREMGASEKKGGPNASATLVEKYGKCQEVVGRGAFGIVRISHKRSEGQNEKLYAVKEFRRRPDETEKKYSKRLTAEFCISSSLRHPNVIHTLDLLKDAKGDYCEVMEYCSGGDLYTLVLAAGKLETAEADCYFKQLMRGVEYLHEMGVAHRDLKPENLLLTTSGSLKITDFGNGECFRMAWETQSHMVSGLCGSAPYIAPEEYIDSEFDARAVDVWATGVIYMAMRTGRHLWRVAKRDEDEFYDRYLEGRRDEEGYGPIESLHRARCRNVIYSVLDPNPKRRITATQVLKSEWGREISLCKAGEEGF